MRSGTKWARQIWRPPGDSRPTRGVSVPRALPLRGTTYDGLGAALPRPGQAFVPVVRGLLRFAQRDSDIWA